MAQFRVTLVHNPAEDFRGPTDVYAIALVTDGRHNRVPGDPSKLLYFFHEMTRLPWPTSQAAGAP